MIEAFVDRLLGEPPQLVIVIAEPAGRRRVAGVAFPLERRYALGLSGLGLAENSDRLVAGEHIRHVAIVDDVGDLFRRHVGNEPPDGFARFLGKQVPDGVDHGAGGEMDRPLFGADPSQLAVTRQVPPKAPRIGEDVRRILTDDQVLHSLNRHAADIVAPADGEGETMARNTGAVRVEDDIGRGIIRVRIHRIGAVKAL
ncbi:hypothetical protein D9M70_506180 [compost metagenome]